MMRAAYAATALVCTFLLHVPSICAAEKLYFVSARDGAKAMGVYSMNSDGSNPIRLTEKGKIAVDPAVSPDGKRIAYVEVMMEVRPAKTRIVVMNLDGSARRQVTNEDELACAPAWSGDGKQFAFSTMDPDDVHKHELFVIDTSGKNRRRLGEGMLPRWSPDGKIAYSKMGDDGRPTLHIMDADGKNSKQLVDGLATMAVWSPDGKQIAYVGEGASDQTELFIMNADGTNARHLTATPDAFEFGPDWSSDRKRIFYFGGSKVAGGPRDLEIYSIGIDGKDIKQLTDNRVMDCLSGGAMLMGRAITDENDSTRGIRDDDHKP